MIQIGDPVVYVDEFGNDHHAIVTAVHGGGETPSLNVVYVSSDSAKHDPYGRQVERGSSVVHESFQQAHGRKWHPA